MTTTTSATTPVMHYPWQAPQWQQLSSQIDRERLPHALLLTGPSYTGKRQFALTLAQKLLCESPLSGYACGSCKQCQLLKAGSHPDLLVVEPEDEGKAIRVDNVRQLGEFFNKTAQQGGWKISIIAPAEAMNLNSANALLKNLEEPNPNTLLLLVTHEPSRLLPTIRSRCRVMKFPVPPINEVRPWLSQVVAQDQNTEQLLAFSDGKPLLALKLVENDWLDQRRTLDSMLDDLVTHKTTPLLAAEKCQTYDTQIAVDWLYARVAADIRGEGGVSPRLMFRYLDRVTEAKKLIQSGSNPNVQLLWEELLINWQLLHSNR